MATYTNIPDSVLEPGKPIRSVDGLALRDNPIAIAEGAPGAPRIQTSALANSVITTAKVANANITAEKLAVGAPENAWVRSRIAAGASAGVVGTHVFAGAMSDSGSAQGWPFGSTIAGSFLQTTSVQDGTIQFVLGGALTGTWRVLGARAGKVSSAQPRPATLLVRIS